MTHPETLRIRKTEPRPSIDELKGKITGGANIHEVIGSVLLADSTRIFRYFRTPDSTVGSAIEPVNEEVVSLYDLPQPGQKLPDTVSEGFISGFYFVAGTLYPSLFPVSKGTSEVSPGEGGETTGFSEGVRKGYVEQSPTNPALRAELEDALKTEPSADRWLNAQVDTFFADNESELAGAKSALSGAKKLYEELSAA